MSKLDQFNTLLAELIQAERDEQSHIDCGWDEKERQVIEVRLAKARQAMKKFADKI